MSEIDILEQAAEGRRKQALALAQSSGPAARAALEELLADPDESVHWFARQALDLLLSHSEPAEASALSLIEELESASDPATVGRLVCALGARREPRVRDRLLAYLRHPSPWVRASAVTGFWGWDDPVVHRAVTELGRDESARVRGQVLVHVILSDRPEARSLVLRMTRASVPVWAQLATVYGLGRARRSWTGRELTRLAAAPELASVARRLAREGVAAAHAQRGDARARDDSTVRTDLTRNLPAIPDERALLDALRDSDVLFRVHALQNAVRFPAAATLPELRRLATTEEDPLFLASLMVTLGALGGPDERPTILRFLDHPDARVRANALQVLSTMPGSLPPEQVTALLADGAARVRTQAAAYLFRRDPAAALRHFQELVLGADNQAREAALFTLARLRDPRVLELFREALLDRRRHVYRHAHEVLAGMAQDWTDAAAVLDEYREGQIVGEVIDGEPVTALIAQLDSATPTERIEAMSKLVAAEDPRVEMMLELNLAARDPDVRAKAAQVLSQRHVKQTLPRLHRRLGQAFVDLADRGFAPVPRALALELAPLAVAPPEIDELANDESERRHALGRALYRAFRDGIPMDAALARGCQEIHSFETQMESYGSRTAVPARAESALTAVAESRPDTRRDAPQAPERVAVLSPAAELAAGSSYAYLGAGLVGAVIILMGVSYEIGRRAGAAPRAPAHASADPNGANALFHVNGPR